MNDYLLDVHALIWFHEENPLLSADADAVIRNRANKLYVHIASLWEISIKIIIGKLLYYCKPLCTDSLALERNSSAVISQSLYYALFSSP